jgi:hypothetical protein
MAFDDIYRPFLDSGRRLVRDSLSGARANPGAMVGVPNAQRDDPYPRFDPTAATRRDIGATAWGSVYGEEPRTPEELEVASGVDRRIPDAPREWSEPTRIPGLGSYATTPDGGYALSHGDAGTARRITPSPLFSGVAGEDFEATRRRGEQVARLMRETDGPFANPNDWNYVRSYGPRAAAQAVASGRANISGAPAELVAQERERFLRNRTTDLSISPQLRSAARDELAQIERDAAEERRREMWAAEQAARLEGARIAASVPVVGPGGVAAIPNADGGWDVSRPEPAPAAPPAPVSFGGGAGAIPEIGEDGKPTYVYQAPPTPDASAAPWVPGGGASSVNRVTGEVKTAPGATNANPNDPKNWKKVGSDIVNVVTNERISGYDARRALDTQIGQLRAAAARELLPENKAAIEAQIAELEAQKQALGVADAQAPEAAAATTEPAAQGGASSPSEPSPAAAQPAASSSPTGHRRWTPGA